MLCNECNENEAQITYTSIEDNEVKEVHICQECMQKLLFEELQLPFFQDPSMANFLQQFFSMFATGGPETTSNISCPYCGHTLKEFKETSFLGCEHCYESFEEELSRIIPRLQGSTEHKGYIPKNFHERKKQDQQLQEDIDSIASSNHLEEIEKIKEELSLAVKEERYEEAAIYRDKIKKLEESDREEDE